MLEQNIFLRNIAILYNFFNKLNIHITQLNILSYILKRTFKKIHCQYSISIRESSHKLYYFFSCISGIFTVVGLVKSVATRRRGYLLETEISIMFSRILRNVQLRDETFNTLNMFPIPLEFDATGLSKSLKNLYEIIFNYIL